LPGDTLTSRVTLKDMRRGNRSAVLRPLLLDGTLNRIALGRMTGLSSASVTNVITELLEEHLVVEAGTEESEGGRPRVQLSMNPDFGVVLGVDIGETGVRVEAFDLTRRLLGGEVVPIDPHRPIVTEVVADITRTVNKIAAATPVIGVGVGVPGIVTGAADQASVNAPNIGWVDVPLSRLLSEAVAKPVFVDNCAKTLGLAEMWFGAGRGARDAIVVLLGTGVGSAIFSRGQLFRGVSSSAGEWGHTCIAMNGRRCRCGRSGCVEAYIGAYAIVDQWTADAQGEQGEQAEQGEEAVIDDLIRAACRQAASQADTQAPAKKLLDEVAQAAGVALASLVNLFNPERIVIGGWLGLRLGPLLLPRIKEVLSQQALSYPAARVSIQLGELGRDAVALGASTLVLDDLVSRGGKPRPFDGSLPRPRI
jgi:predicted NBD/HSP70 family sugar kinase